MRRPLRWASATRVSGSSEPSRCMCSSALGRLAMKGDTGGVTSMAGSRRFAIPQAHAEARISWVEPFVEVWIRQVGMLHVKAFSLDRAVVLLIGRVRMIDFDR